MENFQNLEIGKIGLIQETADGRITQIGLTQHQSDLLQELVKVLSDKPLIRLPKEYDLKLKNQ
jgi:hypothetical protein